MRKLLEYSYEEASGISLWGSFWNIPMRKFLEYPYEEASGISLWGSCQKIWKINYLIVLGTRKSREPKQNRKSKEQKQNQPKSTK
jgi:hypothetical protein